MARLALPLFLYAETPLHPGTGSHLGAVDLPVQRERHTGYPIVQGSSLKGVFRALAGEMGWNDAAIEAVFGPDTEHAEKHAGAVTFTDARILLFPVRAIGTVFVWTTCHEVLGRLRRDLLNASADGLPAVSDLPASGDGALVAPDSKLIGGGKSGGPIVLEEFSYEARADASVKDLARWLGRHVLSDDAAYAFWREKLLRDLAVLPSDEFREFTRTATEVVTRVRLNEKAKTVKTGGLWTEEHVPSDSAFWALVLVNKPGADGTDWTAEWVAERLRSFDGQRVQIGGDETTGRGFCLVRIGGAADGQAG